MRKSKLLKFLGIGVVTGALGFIVYASNKIDNYKELNKPPRGPEIQKLEHFRRQISELEESIIQIHSSGLDDISYKADSIKALKEGGKIYRRKISETENSPGYKKYIEELRVYNETYPKKFHGALCLPGPLTGVGILLYLLGISKTKEEKALGEENEI